MNAIILAAGRGSRLGHITDTKPKCLTPIAGRTLLDWQVASLKAGGIEKITVVTGYQAQEIQGDFETLHNDRWDQGNMLRTLCCADSLLIEKAHLISYSDIVYHPWIPAALAADMGKTGSGISITYDEEWQHLWEDRFEDPLSDAESFVVREGYLQEIGGRVTDISMIQGQYMGLFGITPEGWCQILTYLHSIPDEKVGRLDMTGLFRRVIQMGFPIRCVPVQGRWCEVDQESDLRMYERRIAEGGWSHDWRWPEKSPW